MDITVLGKDELTNFRDAMDAIGAEAHIWAKESTEVVAKVIVEIGRKNLENREGGGKYTRQVASVEVLEDREGFAAALLTPWMGMEFGGNRTVVWSGTTESPNNHFNYIGSGRSEKIGLEPMWAPWHETSKKGYIIGATWNALDKGEATGAMADAMLAGIVATFDEHGVEEG